KGKSCSRCSKDRLGTAKTTENRPASGAAAFMFGENLPQGAIAAAMAPRSPLFHVSLPDHRGKPRFPAGHPSWAGFPRHKSSRQTQGLGKKQKPPRHEAQGVSTAFEKRPSLTHMKPNREKIEAEELVKERLPLTKWELTPKEKEDFDRVMRLMFDAANILRYDLELGEDAIGKTLKELADWATN